MGRQRPSLVGGSGTCHSALEPSSAHAGPPCRLSPDGVQNPPGAQEPGAVLGCTGQQRLWMIRVGAGGAAGRPGCSPGR